METISSIEFKKEYRDYIVFFDLDKTITKTVSGRIIALAARKKGLLKGSDLINALYNSFAFRFGIKDQLKIINDMVSWVKGIEETALLDLCSDVFNNAILPSFHREAISEIEFHKKNNAKLVILSSSLEPLCIKVADYLKMDDIICTRLELIDGVYTGRLTGIPCFREGKVAGMTEYCEKNNSKSENAWYYGDSESDIPVLNAVGHPVCINPDKTLLKRATEKNWTIYRWT
jgi:HAD superfamily hydrolase (TIGR01490 family)